MFNKLQLSQILLLLDIQIAGYNMPALF